MFHHHHFISGAKPIVSHPSLIHRVSANIAMVAKFAFKCHLYLATVMILPLIQWK